MMQVLDEQYEKPEVTTTITTDKWTIYQPIGFDSVKDSGERQDFDTGSRRDTRKGKGRFDLLPPFALKRLAQLYENGAEKYGDRNWELGQPLSRYMDSAIRHINCHMMGMVDEDHLIQAVWNLLGYVETQTRVNNNILPKELDDMSKRLADLDGRTYNG